MKNTNNISFDTNCLDYFHINNITKTEFWMVPEYLFKNPIFARLSAKAKLLYGHMRSLVSLAAYEKNEHGCNHVDSYGHIYIDCSVKHICDTLICKPSTAKNLRKELREAGLVQFVSIGQGNPDHVYVMNYIYKEGKENNKGKVTSEQSFKEPSNQLSRESSDHPSREPKSQTSREPDSCPNNYIASDKKDIMSQSITSIYNTDSKDDSPKSASSGNVSEQLKRQIEYEQLLVKHPDKQETIKSVVNLLISELQSCKRDDTIGDQTYTRAEICCSIKRLTMPMVSRVINRLKPNDMYYFDHYCLKSLFKELKLSGVYDEFKDTSIDSPQGYAKGYISNITPSCKRFDYEQRQYTQEEFDAFERKKLGLPVQQIAQ